MTSKAMLTRMVMAILAGLLLVSCGSSDEPTLIFAGGTCTYNGPDEVGLRFTLSWVLDDPGVSGSNYAIVVLDAGKTVTDLAQIPAVDPPPTWVRKVAYDQAFEPGTYPLDVDLTIKAAYSGDPLYIVCMDASKDMAIGAVGPIRVSE